MRPPSVYANLSCPAGCPCGVAGLVDRPRPGRPRLGSPKLGDRIRRLLTRPKAWTIARLYQRLGPPALSLRTLRRRVSEVASWRRPRQVHAFFRARTPQQMLTTAAPHSSPWLPEGYVQHPRQAA